MKTREGLREWRPFDLDLDGDLAMTEPQVRWTARVEETFNKLRYADRDAQELACKSIQDEFGSEEAGAKLRELFKIDRAKLLERAAEITAKIENGKTEAEASNPKVQPIRAEPKVGAGGGWRFVQKADGSKWWVKGNDWRRHFGPPPTGKPDEPKPTEERVVELNLSLNHRRKRKSQRKLLLNLREQWRSQKLLH
jgi:hypothetical protein